MRPPGGRSRASAQRVTIVVRQGSGSIVQSLSARALYRTAEADLRERSRDSQQTAVEVLT
jgi:hypothetical protein